jgi:hypothetical protein
LNTIEICHTHGAASGRPRFFSKVLPMKRFRFTLLAVCLLLLYLGWNDVSLYLRNPSPLTIEVSELERSGAPREWLHVTDGIQDLEEAISTSGSVDIDALLIPLKSSTREDDVRVLLETRHPALMEHFKAYHFKQDSAFAKEKYLRKHAADFHSARDVTGMIAGGLVASGNRDKLMQLAKDVGMDAADDVIFISEGKEPSRYRGFFFLAVGLLGLVKVLLRWRKSGMRAV